ncbi:MAG TPA: PPK2 family polyphosphate kinase [Acidimicrobiia bacterium]|nr:PPK2 family polyphosphate kinase [Acidimicrobiia bacterium]
MTDDITAFVRSACRVEPGEKSNLGERATDDRLRIEKGGAQGLLAERTARLSVLHGRLHAERKRSVLLVLQGLDASGKDGTIRRVFTGLNPQGCDVESFNVPTPTEAAHDYLWRIHRAMPARGDIGIFNRSHYEDVVAARVIGAIDDDQRKRRYEHINNFEKMLLDEGTTMVKIFLHVGKDEQRRRLQARLDDPEKRWKFDRSDLETRKRWDEYLRLYDSAITATSTKWAPWYVVPADHKWVSGVAAATILLHTLDKLDPKIPPPKEPLDGIVVP